MDLEADHDLVPAQTTCVWLLQIRAQPLRHVFLWNIAGRTPGNNPVALTDDDEIEEYSSYQLIER